MNDGAIDSIPFNSNLPPADLALNVANTLNANGYTVAISTASPNVLNVTAKNGVALSTTAVYNVTGADPAIIIGRPGLNTVPNATQTLTPVFITNDMAAVQVRDQIRIALALGLNVAGQETNTEAYRVRGNSVLIHDSLLGMDVSDPGPLTFSHSTDFFTLGLPSTIASPRVGDDFGPRDANQFFTAALAAQRNAAKGFRSTTSSSALPNVVNRCSIPQPKEPRSRQLPITNQCWHPGHFHKTKSNWERTKLKSERRPTTD